MVRSEAGWERKGLRSDGGKRDRDPAACAHIHLASSRNPPVTRTTLYNGRSRNIWGNGSTSGWQLHWKTMFFLCVLIFYFKHLSVINATRIGGLIALDWDQYHGWHHIKTRKLKSSTTTATTYFHLWKSSSQWNNWCTFFESDPWKNNTGLSPHILLGTLQFVATMPVCLDSLLCHVTNSMNVSWNGCTLMSQFNHVSLSAVGYSPCLHHLHLFSVCFSLETNVHHPQMNTIALPDKCLSVLLLFLIMCCMSMLFYLI